MNALPLCSCGHRRTVHGRRVIEHQEQKHGGRCSQCNCALYSTTGRTVFDRMRFNTPEPLANADALLRARAKAGRP